MPKISKTTSSTTVAKTLPMDGCKSVVKNALNGILKKQNSSKQTRVSFHEKNFVSYCAKNKTLLRDEDDNVVEEEEEPRPVSLGIFFSGSYKEEKKYGIVQKAHKGKTISKEFLLNKIKQAAPGISPVDGVKHVIKFLTEKRKQLKSGKSITSFSRFKVKFDQIAIFGRMINRLRKFKTE
ncbi:MAG: hypothetical protein CMO44_11480 [Verrucomicrobiales bacterium]|nr:hypothetical protein [Verrucomicrobiales bacterium]